MEDIGKAAYDLYAKFQNDVNNCEVEPWEDMDQGNKEAWTGMAVALEMRYRSLFFPS